MLPPVISSTTSNGTSRLDGDSHGPMGQELLEGLVRGSPEKDEQALRPACSNIQARSAPEWPIQHTSRAACGVKATPET